MGATDEQDFEHYRPYLMRYAMLQVRDAELAGDVVQETLLAAIEGRAQFSGKSSRKTWLTGILRHKLIDAVRRQSREVPLAPDEDASEADAVEALFKDDGHWRRVPRNWGDPERAFENARFWEVFESCAGRLPARTARAFMLREVMELDTEEICKELAITPTNLWVMLHRARLALRECLETRWFGRPPG